MGVSLRQASESETASYLLAAEAAYASDLVESGVDPTEAARRAKDSYNRHFADGVLTKEHLLLRVEHEGDGAGFVWIGPFASGNNDHWWLWDIVIDETFRGKGVGRQTMMLAETAAKAAGAVTLGLNVFTHNAAAMNLYRSLGFEATSTHMRKTL